MKVAFDQLPASAKVWMYQADRKFTDMELAEIESFSEIFLSDWESHGIPVSGAIDVVHGMCIRVSAFTDEDAMCGRAQDAQVRFMKDLESRIGIQLTNRMLICLGEPGQETILHLSDLNKEIQAGNITVESPFYNNLVLSKEEFESNWKTKAGSSWISTYF